jgi:hypothetical protein
METCGTPQEINGFFIWIYAIYMTNLYTTVNYAWDSTWHSTWYSISCKLTNFNHSKVKMINTAISSFPNQFGRNKPCRSH